MITLIDLSKLNSDEIISYAKSNGLSAKQFLRNKENGISKIWFIIQDDNIINISYMVDGKIIYTDQFSKYLNSMTTHTPDTDIVPLTIDNILDKISLVGINNISESEKDFLKKL